MTNHEQHQQLVEILAGLVDVLDCEELACLAHHCGVKISEFYDPEEVPEEMPEFMQQSFDEWVASMESEQALPAHKRQGYAEAMYDRADTMRKEAREL